MFTASREPSHAGLARGLEQREHALRVREDAGLDARIPIQGLPGEARNHGSTPRHSPVVRERLDLAGNLQWAGVVGDVEAKVVIVVHARREVKTRVVRGQTRLHVATLCHLNTLANASREDHHVHPVLGGLQV